MSKLIPALSIETAFNFPPPQMETFKRFQKVLLSDFDSSRRLKIQQSLISGLQVTSQLSAESYCTTSKNYNL